MKNYVEIFATIATIIGFFLVSTVNFATIGFTVSAIANVLWILWGLQVRANGIITVNACLLVAAFNGILNALP
jgi:hypothetical protein